MDSFGVFSESLVVLVKSRKTSAALPNNIGLVVFNFDLTLNGGLEESDLCGNIKMHFSVKILTFWQFNSSQSLSYTLVGSKQSQLFIGPFFKHYAAIFTKEKLIFLQFQSIQFITLTTGDNT